MSYIDKLAYAVLFSGFLVGIVAIVFLRYNPTNQFAVIVSFSIFYLLWAVAYHLFRRDLDPKLFLEYLIIASIASVVGFLVFGS